MQNPADLQVAMVLVSTAGAGVVTTVADAIASPGANLRVRLWSAHLSGQSARTGRLWGDISTAAGAAPLAQLGAAVGGSDEWHAPGGIVAPVATAIDVRTQSDIASQSFRLAIYYTIERAT